MKGIKWVLRGYYWKEQSEDGPPNRTPYSENGGFCLEDGLWASREGRARGKDSSKYETEQGSHKREVGDS